MCEARDVFVQWCLVMAICVGRVRSVNAGGLRMSSVQLALVAY